MQPEVLFQWVNPIVLPGWALLLFAPGWRWTQRIAGALIPALLAVIYLVTLASAFSGGAEGGFTSLAAVGKLFQNQMALVAGWTHYLAFDLFVGAWEVRDARRQRISQWFVAPCVLLTFIAGPLGLLAYFAVRLSAGEW